jgi:hypothetical protein
VDSTNIKVGTGKGIFMTLNKRMSEMMSTPMNQLPPLAFEYMKYMCKKYGGCGEIMVTAYAHYAQSVEGLECDDRAYCIDEDGRQWFKENNK